MAKVLKSKNPKEMENYLEINRKLWNAKTDVHFGSDFYAVDAFLKGDTSLKEIELDLLGDIKGKRILHLQCHFGQDSLSLARMGAKVTGVDLSDQAIAKAKQMNEKLGLDAEFICCNVYDIDQHLNGEKFDIIFATYGTIGWLPELGRWAQLIAQHLQKDGKLVFVEFHPVIWAFDDHFTKIEYSYFNKEAIYEITEGTYTDRKAPLKNESYSWNHPLSEVFKSLLGNGLRIDHFDEYDYSPYDCFPKTVAMEKGYQIQGMEGNLPMVYSIIARHK